MIVAGIDPGSNLTGYCFLQEENSRIKVLEYGVIKTKPKYTFPQKLAYIYASINDLLDIYHPSTMAIETAFVAKYPKAALALGHTRGILLLAAQIKGIQIFEYSPRSIKRTVTGLGKATKYQVASMVQTRLFLKNIPTPSDAADALAVAYCHLGKRSLLL